jgi:PAS domain S-box-containing protein
MVEPADQKLRDALAFAESIIDTMRDPLLVLDEGLRVVTASREFYRTFGVKREETEGRLVYELGNQQWDIPRLRTLLETILPQNTSFRDYEVEHVFEGIGRKVMLLNARKLYRDQNASHRILLVIEDVTERRDAEEARREAEARFTEMVKNVRDHSIFLTDADGAITSWNVAAERIIGYTEAEAVGKHFSLIFTPEDVEKGLPEWELRTAREQGRAEDERWHLKKDGTRFWALGIVTPLHDAGGRLTGFSKILRDITDRKRADEALRASEERLRRMINVAVVGVLIFDQSGTLLDANDAFLSLTGYGREEVAARALTWRAMTPPEYVAESERQVHRVKATGRIGPYEKEYFRKDGSRLWMLFAGASLGDGTIVEYCIDISDRKRAEAALRESEERLRIALSAGSMGTWLWRILTDEQILGDSLRRLMGLPPGQGAMTLERFLQAVHPDDRGHLRGEFDRCLREGCEIDVEFRVVWPDGSEHWLKDKGKGFAGPDGRPLFMAGACVDITDRRRMEQQLREADRRKDEFLAMLGHELRNPLAPLRGVVETLQRQQLDGDGLSRAYGMMERQVGHLTRLVDDLLDVSRITRGLVELRQEPVNVAEVADQAVEMVTPAIEGRGHDLSLALPRKPLRVEGDATRLTQVVFNLLNNAAKYTDPGGRIWLAVEREGDRAVVRVCDNGSGMKPDLVPRVFDLFTQGERTLDRSQGGLGLGLTLVKRLVEMHGGTVEARSEGPGKGSEFTVRLPALPAEADQSQPARAPGPPQAKVQVARALVIDDNFDVAESTTWMLEGLARDIKMVHSGAAALELVRAWRPDVILCDIGMPGMDGYETCRRLRQVPGMETPLVAAVSGYGGEEDRERSKEAGFDRHLVKPIGRAALEELLGGLAADQ